MKMQIQDKKIAALIVLSIAAVFSLIYGITYSPKIKRQPSTEPQVIQQEKSKEGVTRFNSTERYAKRTSYNTWGRNPFIIKKIHAKTVTELTLSGIMWDLESPRAIINNEVVKETDKIGENTVIEIRKTSVILNDGTENFELRLIQY